MATFDISLKAPASGFNISFSADVSVAITTVLATGAVNALTVLPPSQGALTGVQGNTAVQSVAPSTTKGITTVLGTGSAGMIGRGEALTKVSGVGLVGDLTFSQNKTVAITGVQALGYPKDDPAFNQKIILRGEGTNGGSVIDDESNYNLTATNVGGVTTSTFTFKRGTSSLHFPNASRLEFTNRELDKLWSGDFSIRGTVYLTTIDYNHFAAYGVTPVDVKFTEFGFKVGLNAANRIRFFYPRAAGTGVIDWDSLGLVINTQYELLIERQGSILRLFINGVLKTANDPNLYSLDTSTRTGSPLLYVGDSLTQPGYGVDNWLRGYLDEFEIVMGGSDYHTSGFTPIAVALPPAPQWMGVINGPVEALTGNEATTGVGTATASITGPPVTVNLTGVQAVMGTGYSLLERQSAVIVRFEGTNGGTVTLIESGVLHPSNHLVQLSGGAVLTTSEKLRGVSAVKTPSSGNYVITVDFSSVAAIPFLNIIRLYLYSKWSLRIGFKVPAAGMADAAYWALLNENLESTSLTNVNFRVALRRSGGSYLLQFSQGTGSNSYTMLQWTLPAALTASTWYEIHLNKETGGIYAFIDGALVSGSPQSLTATAPTSSDGKLRIGHGRTEGGINYTADLVIDEVEINVGGASYPITTFTPVAIVAPNPQAVIQAAVWPITRITGVSATGGPNSPDVLFPKLLMPFEGTNGGTTFADNSSYAGTVSNAGATNVTTSTTRFKRGLTSGFFTSTRDSFLTVPNSTRFILGTQNFVIRASVGPTANVGNSILSHGFQPGIDDTNFGFQLRSFAFGGNSRVSFWYPIAGDLTAAQTWNLTQLLGESGPGSDELTEVSLERTGNLLYLFIDGVVQGAGRDVSAMVAATNPPTTPLVIGACWNSLTPLVDGYEGFAGYIDDVEVSVGPAANTHTTSYTPGPLPYASPYLPSTVTAVIQQPVTVAITGVQATGSVGKLHIGRQLAGNQATGLVVAPTTLRTVALTGVFGTGAVNKLGVGRGITTVTSTGAAGLVIPAPPLSSVSGTGAVGDLEVDIILGQGATLVGVEVAGAVGALAVNHSQGLSGVFATGAVQTLWTGRGITSTPGTGGVGSVGKTHDNTVTGVQGTSAVQSVAANLHSVPLTGNQGTTAIQGVGTRIDPFRAISTVLGTGSVDTLTPSTTLALTTVVGASGLGSVAFAISCELVGVLASGSVGSAGYTTDYYVPLSGNQATGLVQTIAPLEAYGSNGVQATGAVGAVVVTTTVLASGVGATGSVGGVVFSRPVTVAITGVSASAAINSLNPGVLIGVSGVQSVIALGMLAVERLKDLTGVSAQSFTASPSTACLVPSTGVSGASGIGVFGYERGFPVSGVQSIGYVNGLYILVLGQYTYRIRQGGTTVNQSEAQSVSLFLPSEVDHNTAVLSATITLSLSKHGGALVPIIRTITEVGAGWYSVQLTANDTDTLGDLIVVASAPGADTTAVIAQVVVRPALEGPVQDQFNNLGALVVAMS